MGKVLGKYKIEGAREIDSIIDIKAVDTFNGHQCLLKIYPDLKEEAKKDLQQKIVRYRKLRHKSILPLYDAFIASGKEKESYVAFKISDLVPFQNIINKSSTKIRNIIEMTQEFINLIEYIDQKKEMLPTYGPKWIYTNSDKELYFDIFDFLQEKNRDTSWSEYGYMGKKALYYPRKRSIGKLGNNDHDLSFQATSFLFHMISGEAIYPESIYESVIQNEYIKEFPSILAVETFGKNIGYGFSVLCRKGLSQDIKENYTLDRMRRALKAHEEQSLSDIYFTQEEKKGYEISLCKKIALCLIPIIAYLPLRYFDNIFYENLIKKREKAIQQVNEEVKKIYNTEVKNVDRSKTNQELSFAEFANNPYEYISFLEELDRSIEKDKRLYADAVKVFEAEKLTNVILFPELAKDSKILEKIYNLGTKYTKDSEQFRRAFIDRFKNESEEGKKLKEIYRNIQGYMLVGEKLSTEVPTLQKLCAGKFGFLAKELVADYLYYEAEKLDRILRDRIFSEKKTKITKRDGIIDGYLLYSIREINHYFGEKQDDQDIVNWGMNSLGEYKSRNEIKENIVGIMSLNGEYNTIFTKVLQEIENYNITAVRSEKKTLESYCRILEKVQYKLYELSYNYYKSIHEKEKNTVVREKKLRTLLQLAAYGKVEYLEKSIELIHKIEENFSLNKQDVIKKELSLFMKHNIFDIFSKKHEQYMGMILDKYVTWTEKDKLFIEFYLKRNKYQLAYLPLYTHTKNILKRKEIQKMMDYRKIHQYYIYHHKKEMNERIQHIAYYQRKETIRNYGIYEKDYRRLLPSQDIVKYTKNKEETSMLYNYFIVLKKLNKKNKIKKIVENEKVFDMLYMDLLFPFSNDRGPRYFLKEVLKELYESDKVLPERVVNRLETYFESHHISYSSRSQIRENLASYTYYIRDALKKKDYKRGLRSFLVQDDFLVRDGSYYIDSENHVLDVCEFTIRLCLYAKNKKAIRRISRITSDYIYSGKKEIENKEQIEKIKDLLEEADKYLKGK